MKMDFMDMVRAPCSAANKVLRAWLKDVPPSLIDSLECKPAEDHVFSHAEGLKDRIGYANSLSIERQLRGTPYEWMLDLHATQWPEDLHDATCFGW
eukprot:scaffold911_cov361-Prasinococcus_capsulatus_cf.AAC.9